MFIHIQNESAIYARATENYEKCLAINDIYNSFAGSILHGS